MFILVHEFAESAPNLASIVGADTRWGIAWMFFFTGFGFFGLKTCDAGHCSANHASRWQTAFRTWLAFGGIATLTLLLFEPIHLVIWLPAFGKMIDILLRKSREIGIRPHESAGIESITPKQ